MSSNMSDSFNSDDERYADDTFEQESDTDVPEMGEIESEISEVSGEDDDDRLPSVKMNTGPIKRTMNYTNIKSAKNNTDAVPFDTSSDEEGDVIVGQTLAEINTPSMHFIEGDNRNTSKSLQHLKTVDDQSYSSISEEDSDEEREFQRIRDMEERYLQQNSAKTPKTKTETKNAIQPSDNSDEQETETEVEVEVEAEVDEDCPEKVPTEADEYRAETVQRNESNSPNSNKSATESVVDPIPELLEKVMEQFTPQPRVPQQIQTNFMEIIQNSLTSLLANSSGNKLETPLTEDIKSQASGSKNTAFSFESNHMLNPENIATALITAMSATNVTLHQKNYQTESTENVHYDDKEEEVKETIQPNLKSLEASNMKVNDVEPERSEQEVELETTNPPSQSADDDYDEESYYHTQFEYEITSKPPSCFNSEDYVFHANFIRPSATTDTRRPRPQPRKSMSFSNERMREIERHNQILLRKILTQKPTYILKNNPPKSQPIKTTSQKNNGRMTTSAVNRKKQQRQIDLDNQVLKRKIEAISLRRRPLISS